MSRTTFRPKSVITNGNMSGNLTSLATVLQSLSGASYSLSWSGTSPVGTAGIQASNDYSLDPTGVVSNAGTWTNLEVDVNGTAADTIAITGNTGTAFIDITKTIAYAIRLVYTATSGVGTLNVTVNGKVS